MEFFDWVILIAIIGLLFWAKFYHPEIYNPAMKVVDAGAQAVMKVVESAISNSPLGDSAVQGNNVTEGGG